MRRMILVSTFVAAAILASSSAFAQSTAEATVTPASSGHGRGIGVGALTMLNGTSGGLFTWGNPSGAFHIDGFFGLHRYNHPNGNNTTAFAVGGRGWYHIHAASFADFSLGGGIGLSRWETNPGLPGNDDRIDVSLEVGGQMRAFIVPNVALIADLGLGVTFGQHDDILIGSQSFGGSGTGENRNFVLGTLGIAYFFE